MFQTGDVPATRRSRFVARADAEVLVVHAQPTALSAGCVSAPRDMQAHCGRSITQVRA